MNKPNHKHDHQHHNHPPKKGLHKDWRVWTGVILMIIAMVAFILSDDEGIQPGGGGPNTGEQMPAAD